jgi:hypothetical protein
VRCQTDFCAPNVTVKEQPAAQFVPAAAYARSQGSPSAGVKNAMEADGNVVMCAEVVAKSNAKLNWITRTEVFEHFVAGSVASRLAPAPSWGLKAK